MRLELYEQEECLRQAVEITKAYAQSGENKHGPVTDFLDSVYRKLLDIRSTLSDNKPEENSNDR